MKEYIYNNILVRPDMYNIHTEVEGSGSIMEDKNLLYCRWDDINGHNLEVIFENELSISDKEILDQIVLNSIPSGS